MIVPLLYLYRLYRLPDQQGFYDHKSLQIHHYSAELQFLESLLQLGRPIIYLPGFYERTFTVPLNDITQHKGWFLQRIIWVLKGTVHNIFIFGQI